MLSVKSKPILDFSYKLSKMHRSALPNAVRFTLNDVAKEVKKTTLLEESKKQFQVRKPTFFKKFSAWEGASGYDTNRMQSKVGMIKGNDSKSTASTQIGAQQFAGKVPKKAILPAENMRNGKGLVKPSYKRERKKKPIIAGKGKEFNESFHEAKKQNRPLLIEKNGKGVIAKAGMVLKRKINPLKLKIIASYEKGREINLKDKKPFVNNAATKSSKNMNSYFIKNANKQIEKFSK